MSGPSNAVIGEEAAHRLNAEAAANEIAENFAKGFTHTLNLVVQEQNETDSCQGCQEARAAGQANPCPEDDAGPYCTLHQGRHITRWHLGTELWEQHLDSVAAEFMAERGLFLTGCHEEDKSHVLIKIREKPGTRTGRNLKRSLWYPLARRLGLNPGVVTTWRYPNPKIAEETEEHLKRAVDRFREATGLEPALCTNGSSGITLFMAPADKVAGVRILPENPYQPAAIQTSISGLVFNDTGKPAKIAKRMGIFRFADGHDFTDEPSLINNENPQIKPSEGSRLNHTGIFRSADGHDFTGEPSFLHRGDPHIKLSDGSRINVEVNDTTYVSKDLALERGAGDGNGAIRESAARRLLRMTGITKKLGRVRKIQVNIMGAEFFMKGVFRIIPDDRFQGSPATDLIVDADSVSKQVTNTRFTLIRLIRKDHKRQPGFVYIEPLLQADLAERLLGADELAEVQADLMPQIHAGQYRKAWREN